MSGERRSPGTLPGRGPVTVGVATLTAGPDGGGVVPGGSEPGVPVPGGVAVPGGVPVPGGGTGASVVVVGPSPSGAGVVPVTGGAGGCVPGGSAAWAAAGPAV